MNSLCKGAGYSEKAHDPRESSPGPAETVPGRAIPREAFAGPFPTVGDTPEFFPREPPGDIVLRDRHVLSRLSCAEHLGVESRNSGARRWHGPMRAVTVSDPDPTAGDLLSLPPVSPTQRAA